MRLLLFFLVFPLFAGAQPADSVSRAAGRMADEVFAMALAKYPVGKAQFYWRDATLWWGMEEVYKKDPRGRQPYVKYMRDCLDRFVTPEGTLTIREPGTVDNLCSGITLVFLYRETGDTKYLKAAQFLYQAAVKNLAHARDGALSHFEWEVELWVDSMFLLLTFMARLAEVTGDTAQADQAALQAVRHIEHLQDTATGLFVHGWAEKPGGEDSWQWADSTTGRNRIFWGRGNGWVMAGLYEVLTRLPRTHASYNFILERFKKAAAGLLAQRDPASNLWNNVLHFPFLLENTPETSASALIAFGMSGAVKRGWLDRKSFGPVLDQSRKELWARWKNPVLEGVSPGTDVSSNPKRYLSGRNTATKYGEGAYLAYLAAFMAPEK